MIHLAAVALSLAPSCPTAAGSAGVGGGPSMSCVSVVQTSSSLPEMGVGLGCARTAGAGTGGADGAGGACVRQYAKATYMPKPEPISISSATNSVSPIWIVSSSSPVILESTLACGSASPITVVPLVLASLALISSILP